MDGVEKYLGIPFKDKGRDFSGCDCWGLVRLFLLGEFGIEIDSLWESYAHCRDIESIKKLVEEEKTRWMPVEGPENKGDVLDLSLSKRDFHVGVLAAPGRILHVERGGFSRLDPETSQMICRRVRGRWRHAALRGRDAETR
jgi:cell wall-associated NlpC family hydrolase